jgi:transposase
MKSNVPALTDGKKKAGRPRKKAADPVKPRDVKVAKMKAAGASRKEIAEATGLSIPGVAKVMEKPEIKEMILAEQSKLAELVPTAVENVRKWVNKAHEYELKEDKEIAYKANRDVLQSVGLVAGSQAVVVENLNMQNNFINPVMREVLKEFAASLVKEDYIIDVDFEEEK